MLNPVAKKWVKALRSGKYKQGRSKLRKGDKFCCLGVLCDLAAKEGKGKWGEHDEFIVSRNRSNGSWLPESITKWAGLKDSCGAYGRTALTRRNDAGVNFLKIAYLIEKHADELFVQEPAQ